MGSSAPPHMYPEELQLKLYQAFIFSIPILFAIILLLLFYLFYLKRRASTAYSATPPILPTTSSSSTAPYEEGLKLKGDLKNNLSTVVFDDDLKTKESLCCVCLGEFEMKEELVQVGECKHVFHKECIHKWLRLSSSNSTCPLCRSSLFTAFPHFNSQPINH